MKKNSKRSSKQQKARIRSMVSKVHVLIAVVAIIECLILISFTTYSWIETASSLVIETGKQHYDDSFSTRIPIASALNYKFVPNTETPSASSATDLNTYFSYAGQSQTQNLYRYSRASSANGKDFFFQNSGKNASGTTITGATSYRAGDYMDINSNYTYFDFTVANTGGAKNHKLKFYFDDVNVFEVTNGTGSLSDTQLGYIRDAMRISFQTANGTPKIYACTATSTSAVSATSGSTTAYTPTAIQANANQKLFTVGKNSSANISVRIWLEEKAAGISGLTGAQLASANINVNLKLTYAQNDYDYIYFDDYTFSSGLANKENIGGHLTEDYPESDNYRMYFVYRTSDSTTGYVYPMTIDDSGSNMDAKCWVTCDSSGSASSTVPDITGSTYITNLTTSGNASLTYSYFAYGKCARSAVNTSVTLSSATSTLYRWNINDYLGTAKNASSDSELRYSGFSVTKTASGNSYYYGAGGWSYNTPLSRVFFRDLATGVTANAYNSGDNFKYITAAVNAASDTGSGNRSNVMYVNILNNTTYNATNAAKTATMYFDKGADSGNGLFTSWVPETWLSNSNLNFRYSANGYYNAYSSIKWVAGAATKPNNAVDYIYTGLGYQNPYTFAYYNVNTAATIGIGTGCWNAIESEPVYFSTELIDNNVTNAFRYQIGVKINGGSTAYYYNLIPDETNTKFYAYIPVPGTNANPTTDYADGAILFRSYDQYADSTHTATENGTWYGKVRNGSRIYYPVALNTTSPTTSAPKGYWNLAVIVDGTYEHFFWVPTAVVNGTPVPAHVLGTFAYNTTGHQGAVASDYTNITPNQIDEYRWYVPFDIAATGAMPDSVYFRWEPYTDTVFLYTHYRSDGIYLVITEAPDNT